ncbi:MAG: T9SS type A sorting domain-containing protein [Bacteroidota bacterium]
MKTKITYFLFIFLFPFYSFAASGIWERAVALNFGTTNFVTGTTFNTQNLGTFLPNPGHQLKGGSINTFKNNGDDITGARMFYRVIAVGSTDNISFTSINLPFGQNLPNPGDQQWLSSSDSILFMNGLAPGNYNLEVYFEADFTFLPNGAGVHIDNNNGTNYKAQFTISAPNQGCSINLGNDTTICGLAAVQLGGNFTLAPFGDSLTITYNASSGGAGQLIGASKVYMHSGYEATPFGGAINWVGNWGQDDGIGKMDSLGNNLWRITINPNSYYNVPANGPINGFFLVFRNADGTLVENNGGNNIFLSNAADPVTSFTGVSATKTVSEYTSIVWSTGANTPSILVSESGTYWVQLTNSQGCVAIDTVVVNANNIPFVNISGNLIICEGESTTLTATPGFVSYSWSNGFINPTVVLENPGNYILTVTDANGCTGIDVVDLIELPEPLAEFTFTNIGPNFTFTVTNQYPNAQYFWDFNEDGVNDNVTNSISPTRGFTSNGAKNIRLIVVNQCGSDTLIKPVLVNGIGIDEHKSTNSAITVYPNPATNFVSFNLPSELFNVDAIVSIIDLSGKQVITELIQKTKNGVHTLNVSELPNGIYFITLNSANKNYNSKLIINK